MAEDRLDSEDFRRIALSLVGASENQHMGHPDFRVNGRIFASLQPERQAGMVKLTPGQQQALIEKRPDAFLPESGAWGDRGYTRVLLARVDEEQLTRAILNLEELLDTMAPDFYMYGDGQRVDYAATVAAMRATIPTLQSFETTWSDIEVTAISPDFALVSMRFEDAITSADGSTSRKQGPTTFLWRRDADRWRIIYVDADHYPVSEVP